jgi:vancomycin permeability regulator SanA
VKRAISLGGAAAARGLAILVAVVLLLGVIGEARGRATDLSLWLVDVRDLPALVAWPLLAAIGLALAAWTVAAVAGGARKLAGAAAALALATLAARDVVRYRDAVAGGLVHPAAPVPLSLVVAVVLVLVAIVVVRDHGLAAVSPRRARLVVGGMALVLAAGFPVVQIAFFGTTDYRRPADAAVVLGARVYADGTPSPLLADRIATGVSLYRAGLVPLLVMSGGDGADGWNEADVMRNQAIAAGVPGEAILVDRTGINTEATVTHTIALLAQPSVVPAAALRVVVVSQAYHLPRIQLAYSGAGVDVITVPATDPVPIQEMPLLVAREVPAFWVYYLRAGLGG